VSSESEEDVALRRNQREMERLGIIALQQQQNNTQSMMVLAMAALNSFSPPHRSYQIDSLERRRSEVEQSVVSIKTQTQHLEEENEKLSKENRELEKKLAEGKRQRVTEEEAEESGEPKKKNLEPGEWSNLCLFDPSKLSR